MAEPTNRGGCVCAQRLTERSRETFTLPQAYAYLGGPIEMEDNTMFRSSSPKFNEGGIRSWCKVSLSENAVVFDCTAELGGMLISGTRRPSSKFARWLSSAAAFRGESEPYSRYQPVDFSLAGGVIRTWGAHVVLRDYARITACTAFGWGGNLHGETTSSLTLLCVAAKLINYGHSGSMAAAGSLLSCAIARRVVECQV